MRKLSFLITICLLLAATGCQTLMQNDSPIAQDNIEILNSKNKSNFHVINPDKDNHGVQHFGYVRHQRETAFPRGGLNPEIAAYDPDLLADAISKLAVLTPDVRDVATLVTDREVLVAYDTTSENRFETADQVKRAAMSCVPRFFHVYVSDNPQMIHSIERFGSLSSRTENVHDVLEHTIAEMLKSPQGKRISASENENGEIDNTINGYMDKHNYNNQSLRRK